MRTRGEVVVLAVLAGCSLSTTLPEDAAGDAGLALRDGATDAAGVSTNDAAETGVHDASADAAGVEHEGFVLVLSDNLDDSTIATAFFGPGALDLDRPSCVVARAGACVEIRCPTTPTLSEDAGRIDVLGDGALVASMSDPTHYTTASGSSGTPLGSGQRVTVTAEGGTVPPFSASTTVPATASLISVPSSHDRTADLVVTWAPSTDALFVYVVQLRNATTIRCDVDASVGAVTIAASLLDAFPVATPVSIFVEPWNRATVTAGDYTIDVYALRSASVDTTLY